MHRNDGRLHRRHSSWLEDLESNDRDVLPRHLMALMGSRSEGQLASYEESQLRADGALSCVDVAGDCGGGLEGCSESESSSEGETTCEEKESRRVEAAGQDRYVMSSERGKARQKLRYCLLNEQQDTSSSSSLSPEPSSNSPVDCSPDAELSPLSAETWANGDQSSQIQAKAREKRTWTELQSQNPQEVAVAPLTWPCLPDHLRPRPAG